MRNTKEIADYVFSIRDEHLRQKKLKQMRMKKACTAVSVMAAAVIITAGALHFSSLGTKPVQPSGSMVDGSESDKPPVEPAVTSVTSLVSEKKTTTTAAVSAKNDVTAVLSGTKATLSAVSSIKTTTAINAITTVTAASSQNSSSAAATNTNVPVTTDINEVDCEEVIRMKVDYVKKYLAALSAAAIASSGNPISANADSLFTPKPLDPKVDSILYMEDNGDLFDFDGNGKFNTMDAYALYTYVNEASELPEGYAARCEANGDVNRDGKVDFADSNLFKEYCLLKFSGLNYAYCATYTDYLLPADTDMRERAVRSIAPDTPDDIREKLLNEFVDDAYTYGSEKNKKEFIDYVYCNYEINEWTYEKYNDAHFKRFTDAVKKDSYSFDVNEDGVTDLKDLYDIYIYDVASADEKGDIQKSYYFGQYNTVTEQIGDYSVSHDDYDNPLRSRLPLSEEYKANLWEKCEPMYDYVYSFIKSNDENYPICSAYVFDFIARYIINNTEITTINKTSLYYVQYLGEVELCGLSVSESFASYLSSLLDEYSEKPFGYDPNSGALNPDYERIYDYKHLSNEDYVAALQKTKADYDSGVIKKDLFDINLDGKVDPLDSYTYELYSADLHRGLTAETGLVPAEHRKKIEEDFDADRDGKSGTLGDYMFLSYIAGNSSDIPQYMLDIYYLELVEQKGLVDLSDIRPYIEKLCKDKETGDVDLDGKVTAVDASGVLSYYAETSVNAEVSNVTVAMMSYMADLNEDGYVNSLDASAILSDYAENSVQK
ncbi:dockerin type I domain-containing protein [Ruminococcus flavefaciens]|uniref:dockerin type I domain-containing protein n=1 Tax=Ruminococcus flavefaciens TaxID=1265 RepID=UPI0026EA45C9|nr:dockerin type I domain-containing protein [Ruminococcus flavefaciens]